MPAEQRLRVGIVGAGRLAERVLFGVLSRLPGVRVAAIADPSEARQVVARARFPAAILVSDTEALLSACPLDAVVVCSPPATHADAAARALDAGLHVYVEKPLATEVTDARALVERARAAERVAMVGLSYRHHPLALRLRDGIAEGRIGAPLAMRSVFSVADGQDAGWRTSPASGGGALYELGSHHVDLARFLVGAEILHVTARVWARLHEGDGAAVDLELEAGVHAGILLAIGAADEDHVFVLGDRGTAALDRLRGVLVFGSREFQYGRRHALLRGAAAGAAALGVAAGRVGEPSYSRALSAFVDAIRSNRPARPDFTDGLRSLETVDAAVRSASAGGGRVSLAASVSGADSSR